MDDNEHKKIETVEGLCETFPEKCEEENDKNEKIPKVELNEKEYTDSINQNVNNLVSDEPQKNKFMQDSYNFHINKNLFSAPKYYPHFLLKDHTVEYMEPVMKKEKRKEFFCCC